MLQLVHKRGRRTMLRVGNLTPLPLMTGPPNRRSGVSQFANSGTRATAREECRAQGPLGMNHRLRTGGWFRVWGAVVRRHACQRKVAPEADLRATGLRLADSTQS